MKLILLRHGDAGDRDEFAKEFDNHFTQEIEAIEVSNKDDLRPLTKKGIKDIKWMSKLILAQFNYEYKKKDTISRPLVLVLSSFLMRSLQTAEIFVEQAEKDSSLKIIWKLTDLLSPTENIFSQESLWELIQEFREEFENTRNQLVVILVGHNPHLTVLANSLLSSKEGNLHSKSTVQIKKGASIGFEVNEKMVSMEGLFSTRLLWFFNPRNFMKI